MHASAPSGKGLSFVKKKIKGTTQWYLQLTVGSQKTQHYLGPDSEAVRQLIDKEKLLWQQAQPDRLSREQLVAMLVAGGAHTISGEEARLFEVIERAGVFLVGAVLVGSHAFSIYGNMLGVQWPTKITQTHDVDIARKNIMLGLSSKPVDLKKTLLDAEMGFIEVPALNRKSPSTSFRIRGKQLSVDILTPLIGKPTSNPVLVPALKTYAEPVRFLDYLLEDTQAAVIVARAGILVNVPSPARYALHKIVASQRRVTAMHSKTVKDVDQAELLLSVLLADRPGDIMSAIRATEKMPEKFRSQLLAGLKKLPDDLSNSIKNFFED